MKVCKIYGDNIDEKMLAEVANALKSGAIIIYPTDTLYAFGCDALNNNAISKICKLKGINPDKQFLSIVCENISMAAEYARFGNNEFRLLKENTPGPFTFIFPSSSSLPKVFKGRKTVGIRIPDNKIATTLAKILGNPIMSTTIKSEDEDYATNPDLMVETYTDSVDYIIDNGIGGLIPSTIVDCTTSDYLIVREGKGELQ